MKMGNTPNFTGGCVFFELEKDLKELEDFFVLETDRAVG